MLAIYNFISSLPILSYYKRLEAIWFITIFINVIKQGSDLRFIPTVATLVGWNIKLAFYLPNEFFS